MTEHVRKRPPWALVILIGVAVAVGLSVLARTPKKDPPNPQLEPKPVLAPHPEEPKGETSTTATVAKVWISKNGTYDVTVFSCEGPKCDDRKRVAAKVAVRDARGEVTRPEARVDVPLRLDLPVGTYELTAIAGKSRSKPVEVKIEEGKTGQVELLVEPGR